MIAKPEKSVVSRGDVIDVITTYIENGRRFYICKDGRGYWGIENKYVDSNGKLNTVLNGITGHHSESAAETIQLVINTIRVDKLEAESGLTRIEACVLYFSGAEALERYRQAHAAGLI